MTTATLWHAPPFHTRLISAYEISLAATLEDVRACQRLRYEVFNAELGEGLESSHAVGLDRDSFDAICDHLLVRELATGEPVGTYRMQTGYRALGNAGYYSQNFFDFTPYEKIRRELLELGRACVHRGHRDSGVLMLLWKGIFHYARESGCRYLIGCSSVRSQDAADGASLYRELRKKYLAPVAFRTVPQLTHLVPEVDAPETAMKVPRLLRSYFELSAKICGPPAIDREFKTIDFLTLLDLEEIPLAMKKRLLVFDGQTQTSSVGESKLEEIRAKS